MIRALRGLRTCGRLLVSIERIREGDGHSAAEQAPTGTSKDGRYDQSENGRWLGERAIRGGTSDYAPANLTWGTLPQPGGDVRAPGPTLGVHAVIRAAAVADTANCTDAAAPHTLGWRQGNRPLGELFNH